MLISGCIIREPSFSFKGLIIKTSLLPKCYQQQCKKRTFSPIEVRMTLYEGSAITSKNRLQKLITTLQAIAVRSGKRVCDTGETGPPPKLVPEYGKTCCLLRVGTAEAHQNSSVYHHIAGRWIVVRSCCRSKTSITSNSILNGLLVLALNCLSGIN